MSSGIILNEYTPTYWGQQYIQYNNTQEVDYLNQNTFDAGQTIESGTTGRHLYAAPVRHPAYYTCFSLRDKETHYILGVDRDDHPDHSSRFGYARCPNGYCVGSNAGGYNTNSWCCDNAQPSDLAPERFYAAPHQGSSLSYSQANLDYEYMKDYRMNLPPLGNYKKLKERVLS